MSNRRTKRRAVFAAITRADEGTPVDKTKRASEIENAIAKADSDKEAAEKARDEQFDKLMDSLGSLATVCDGLVRRMDAMEGGDPEEVAADNDKRADSAGDMDAASFAKLPRQKQEALRVQWRRECLDAQIRADKVAHAFGEQAPPPMSSETPLSYRRRLARQWQPYSDEFKSVDLNNLPVEALTAIEGRIYADAIKADASRVIPSSGLREIRKKLDSGHTEVTWLGSPGAWMREFAGLGQRVTGEFNTGFGGRR